MKKLIFLLLVISVTALEAQNYQYFTAKQGIPKAMEIAKTYFQSDSVELYEIRCIFWEYGQRDSIIIHDSIIPFNDKTGTSLYWYYLFCDTNGTCLYFRIWNYDGSFKYDSVYSYYINIAQVPFQNKDIAIDTDSLIKCLSNMVCINNLFYSTLLATQSTPFDLDSIPYWMCEQNPSPNETGGINSYISSKTCECAIIITDVKENKLINIPELNIQINPNTDNIIIEPNSDLIQDAELSLYNQVGVLLFADKLNNKSYQLSTYNYPSGLYILQFKYGVNVITKTVMIVH